MRQRRAMIAISAALFAYTLLRACMLSFTHDESFSWLFYVQTPVSEFLKCNPPSGNNHLLNTLGMRICSAIFGNSAFSLRLPNLAGHLLYLGFTAAILLRLKNPLVAITGFSLLNLNPYLLDFFSLARGYGLSMGLLAAFLFFYFRWQESRSLKILIISLLMLSLGITANITLVTLFFATWIITNFFPYAPRPDWVKINLAFLVAGIILLSILWVPVSSMVAAGRIDYGGTVGFWADSVVSLLKKSCYGMPYRHVAVDVITWLLVAAMVAATVLILLHRRGNKQHETLPLITTGLLLLLFAVGSFLQFRLFTTPYLESRTALILWPFLALIPVLTLDEVASFRFFSVPVTIVSVSIILILTFHSIKTLNLDSSLEWRYDADTRRMVERVEKEWNLSLNRSVTLATTWVMEPSINFYRLTLPMPWLNPVDRSGPFIPADFRYATPADADSLLKLHIPVLTTFPASGNTLFKP